MELSALDVVGVSWSVEILDARSGAVLASLDPHATLRTASVAKLQLLSVVANGIVDGSLDPALPLDRRAVDPVADSGLWRHLRQDVLPLADVALLVGAVSDNLATNVLLELVGLDRVHELGADLAPDGSRLHDRVRDSRGPGVPPTLSTGTASDWAGFMVALAGADPARALVRSWLSTGTDLSMVAAGFGLDPLAHADGPDRDIELWNKTGTDRGVRADVGLCELPGRSVAYAVIANWDDGADADPRDSVLAGMREVGESIRRGDTAE